jgi:hypothetical protein
MHTRPLEDNISFSLIEDISTQPSSRVTYDDLLREVDLLEMTTVPNMDDYMANEINYSTNYTKKELDRIADYYEISKRKKRKDDIIQDIVIFEQDPENIELVFRRKKLWAYMKEIKDDKYLRKFLIFN